jgi:hypothetical protein
MPASKQAPHHVASHPAQPDHCHLHRVAAFPTRCAESSQSRRGRAGRDSVLPAPLALLHPELVREEAKVEEKIDNYRYCPVLAVGISYRF